MGARIRPLRPFAGRADRSVAPIRLHEKLGFQQVGLLPQVGTKFGRWLDLAFLQLLLDQRTDPDPNL